MDGSRGARESLCLFLPNKAALLVFQTNDTAAILVDQTNPVRVELFPLFTPPRAELKNNSSALKHSDFAQSEF